MTRRLTRADRERIRAKVEELAEQPRGEPVFGRGLIGFRRAASARCPHCNALVTFPGLDAIFAFVCPECGEGVNLEPPAV